MDEKQIKRKLEDEGLKVADLATEMAAEHGIKVTSADNMLREMIAGRRWYPVYAAWLQNKYAITLVKPQWLMPVRDRMRLAA